VAFAKKQTVDKTVDAIVELTRRDEQYGSLKLG